MSSAPPAVSGVTDDGNIRVAIYQSLRLITMALGDFAPLISKRLVLDAFTAAEIADGNHAVNTENKAAGRVVWDTTNNRVMVASGTSQIAPWYVADGSVSVTPA
jgi:hypothetical protein